MWLSFTSVALLSFFDVGSNAFTPPASVVSGRSSFRAAGTSILAARSAGGELSGLLNEYKSTVGYSSSTLLPPSAAVNDAASSASSAPKVVEEVVRAATSPTRTEDTIRALSDAVTSASNAAEQAAAAASAVTAKTAAATISLAVALPATAPSAATAVKLKPVVGGFGIVQVNPSKIPPPGETFDAAERLDILRSNMGLPKLEETGAAPLVVSLKAAAAKVSGAVATAGAAGTMGDMKPVFEGFVESLHLKEYGGWYVAAAMALVAVQQRKEGVNVATAQFEAELVQARQRANEAAAAAGMAADGARLAKELAMKMERTGHNKGNVMLDTSRMKKLQVENELLEKEMRSLATEVASLKDRMKTKDKEKNTPVIKKNDAEYVTKTVMERDPMEDTRTLEILKQIDAENKIKKNQASEVLEAKREEKAAKKAQAKSEATKMAQEMETAKHASEALEKKRKEKAAKKAQAKLEATKMAEKVEAAKQASEALKKKQEEEAAKKAQAKFEATKTAKEVEAAQAKAGAEKQAARYKGAVTKNQATRKKATDKAKSGATKKSTKQVSVKNVEWHLLSDSTLKRKTIAQLSEYLSERGVSVSDDSGKTRKKAELLEAVRSL